MPAEKIRQATSSDLPGLYSARSKRSNNVRLYHVSSLARSSAEVRHSTASNSTLSAVVPCTRRRRRWTRS